MSSADPGGGRREARRGFRGWDAAARGLEGLEAHHFGFFFALLWVTFLPFLLLGQDAHYIIHDNLDSLVPWLVVLDRQGAMFSGDEVRQVMGGIPRSAFPSGLLVPSLLFSLLPPFPAYLVNHLLVHTLAFLGMYRLLHRHVLPDGRFVNSGVAFCFALLPFYSMLGLSVAGQPLLLSAVLAFAKRRAGWVDWGILLLFPFYSDLVRVGFFLAAALGVWVMVDALRSRRLNPGLLLSLAVLGVGYLVVEWRLLDDVLFSRTYVSHRVEFRNYAAADSYGLFELGWRALVNFFDGHYHAASLHRWILLLAVPGALVAAGRRTGHAGGPWRRQILGLLGLAFLFSLILAFQDWRGLLPLKDRFELLHIFQFGRFHYMHPLLWFTVFALALDVLRRSDLGDLGRGKRLAVALLAAQALFVFGHNQETRVSAGTLARGMLGREDWRTSYAEFYSEDLFGRIAGHIGRPMEDYRVISIGLHPAIAAYNGFHTLDFYMANYPLSYKHRFRRIIARELDASRRWKRYFDGWGCRCYTFASELSGYSLEKTSSRTLRRLELGTDAFRAMGGEYVLSAVQIENHADNGLELEGVFESPSSPWRVWLYRAS